MPVMILTQTMRRALTAVEEGKDPLAIPREKYVTIKTMIALSKRGLVKYDNKLERWIRI